MPYVVKPIDRNQVTMNTLDAMVEWDSIARVIDCFVDHLDLKELGFEKTKPSFEGRQLLKDRCLDCLTFLR